ncbi:MAG: TonB family protein [Terracidiphilus sp.]
MNAPAIRGDGAGSKVDGRFPLLQWIGGSARADVYLTELSEQGQKAAIKLIPAAAEDVESRLAAWEAAGALSHPSLMQVYAFGRWEIDSTPLLYVVTELAEEVLADILPERPLTPKETGEMLGPVLDALAYLHGKGLVHGRLKPSNIMAAGDRPKLSADDLSFAGAMGRRGPDPTVYDAPETASGPIGPEADAWALGATLVAALTQRPPAWDSLAPEDAVLPETMPEPFASIVRDCLRPDPASRCTLQEIGSRLEGKAVPPPSVGASAAPPRPGRLAVGLLLAAGIAATGFGVWNAFFDRGKTAPPVAKVQSAPPVAPAPAAAPAGPPAAARNTAPAPAVAAVPAPVRAPLHAAPPAPQASASPAKGGAAWKSAVVEQVQPDLSPGALQTISGKVRVSVRLAVDENGTVTNASLESAGPSPYFANKALEAARRWRFKPAQHDGRAVASNWILNFAFTQGGVDMTPAETAP